MLINKQQLSKMVTIRGFDGLTFKPQLYGQILSKNLEYMGDCQLFHSFNTHQLIDKGLLQAQQKQFIYLYEQEFLGLATLGLLAELSLIDYQQNKIKKHEQTLVRPHLNETTYAKNHVGPVIVGHEHSQSIDDLLHGLRNRLAPFAEWETVDGRKHKLWRIEHLDEVLQSMNKVSSFYILDGHHRFQAANEHLCKLGSSVNQKDLWIQGLVYSTKYIRSYPQFRKLVHEENRNIIRNIMFNKKLSISEINQYDPNNVELELVLLQNGKFYQIICESDEGGVKPKIGVEKLDEILKQAIEELGCEANKSRNHIKFIPSIMFDFQNISSYDDPIFLVKSPPISTIFEFADQGLILPPKSTWLQPKPCLHMVIRLPY